MATNRCPMCHVVNEGTAWRCGRCGYEFGQPIDKVRELLRGQLLSSRITFWCLLVLLVGVLAGPAYLAAQGTGIVVMPGIVTVVLITRAMLRASSKISISRQSLASLARQQTPLPKATVVASRAH